MGRGESDRPEQGGQWASALRQASMPKGAEHEERRVASRRCACRRKESLQWVRAESEGRGNVWCRARVLCAERFCAAQGTRARGAALRRRPGKARARFRRGGRPGRGQMAPVTRREGSDQKDLMMGLT